MRLDTSTQIRQHSSVIGTDAGGPGKTLIPAIRPTRYTRERGKWDVDLTITRGAGRYRFNVGYIDPTGECRRVHGGPIVPGPYAYAFGLGTAITADPRMSTAYEADMQRGLGIEHEVNEGDLIQLGYELFRVRFDRDQWIELDHAGSAL